MTSFESTPNLAHVVPDSKKQLKGDELNQFFCYEKSFVDDYCSPFYTLHPSKLPLNVDRRESVRGLPTPCCTSLRADGIDAMYIDNVLSLEECSYLCASVDASAALSFWSAAGRENKAARQFRDANTVEMEAPELAQTIYNRIRHLIIDDTSTSTGPCAAGICPAAIDVAPPESVEYEIGSEYYEAHKGDADHSLYEKSLVGCWVPIGLNPDLLLAQYPVGGAFAPHTDGRAPHDFNTGSFYSVVIYLSTIPDGHGGGTRFYKTEALSNLVRNPGHSATTDEDAGRWTVEDAYLLAETRERSTVSPVAGRVLIFNQRLAHEGLPTTLPSAAAAAAADGAVPRERDYTKYIIRSDIMYQRTPQIFTSDRDKEAYRLFREAEVLAEACPMQRNISGDVVDDGNVVSNVEKSILLFKRAMKLSPDLAIFCGYT